MTDLPTSLESSSAGDSSNSDHAPMGWSNMPAIDLRPLLRMTDDTGMFQHALHGTPDPRHGYCIDDNARALIAALIHAQLRGYDERVVPLNRYLAFVTYGYNEEVGAFRNFMGYDRHWLEEHGSEDSQGRTLWALGLASTMGPTRGVRELARDYFFKGIENALPSIGSLRAWAFALLGVDTVLDAMPDDQAMRQTLETLAEHLMRYRLEGAQDDWPWWENTVTYDNAKLPEALLVAGERLGDRAMIDAGLESLRWLIDVQQGRDGRLSIIGNQGWLEKGKQRAAFDQQPLEAWAMVQACLCAAEVTGDNPWADQAWHCFRWFHGYNDLDESVINEEHGGCFDGLTPEGVNRNQGAESVLAYLLSVLQLHQYRRRRLNKRAGARRGSYRWAVASASGFAGFVLDQLRSVDRIEPTTVWSRSEKYARLMADPRDLSVEASLADLSRNPQVDIVHVAGTPATHAEYAIAMLSAGKHVLCEKPLAMDSVSAISMLKAAAERDVILGVNHMMRYGPLFEPINELIGSRLLGAPLRGVLLNAAGDSGLPAEHWFWDSALSGGIFIEHGVHFFDLLAGWLGEGSVVSAWEMKRPGTDLIDQVGCEVRYGSQTMVSMYHGFTQSPHLDRQGFRLVFERGEITVRGWVMDSFELRAVLSNESLEHVQAMFPQSQTKILRQLTGGEAIAHRRHRQEPVDVDVEITWQSEFDAQTVYGRAVRALIEDMLESVDDRRHDMRVTAEDARLALEMAIEATRLAQDKG